MIGLSQNTKKVIYGVLKYPQLNITRVAAKLDIKRATANNINKRLKNDSFYSKHVIPNFSFFGLNILYVIYGRFNVTSLSSKRPKLIKPANLFFSLETDNEFFDIYLPNDFGKFKEELDNFIINGYSKGLFDGEVIESNFSFAQNYLFKMFNFLDLFKAKLGMDDKKEEKADILFNSWKMTNKEKVVLNGLIEHPDITDRELSKKLKLPRPTVSRKRKFFEKANLINYLVIPNFKKFNFGLVVLTHLNYNLKSAEAAAVKIKKYYEKQLNAFLIIEGKTEMIVLSLFEDYDEYKKIINQNLLFFEKRRLLKEKPVNIRFSVNNLSLQNLNPLDNL